MNTHLYNEHNTDEYSSQNIYKKFSKSVRFLSAFSENVLSGYYEATDQTVIESILSSKSGIISVLVRDACKYMGHVMLNSFDPFGVCLNVMNDRTKITQLEETITQNFFIHITEQFDNVSKYSYMVTIMDNFGCDFANHKDVEAIMFDLAEKASNTFITYDTQIRSWASSIYESKMSDIHLRRGSRRK